MHRWCLLNLTVHGFSLNLTVRGVSNKHCLLTFFIFFLNLKSSTEDKKYAKLLIMLRVREWLFSHTRLKFPLFSPI